MSESEDPRVPLPHPTSSTMSQTNDPGSWQNSVPCRYFLLGNCWSGDNCPFSHDITSSGVDPNVADPITGSARNHPKTCHFFAHGNCLKGDLCKFIHSDTHPHSPLSPSFSVISFSSSVDPAYDPNQSPYFSPTENDIVQSPDALESQFQGMTLEPDYQPPVVDTSWAEAPEFVPRGQVSVSKAPEFVPRGLVSVSFAPVESQTNNTNASKGVSQTCQQPKTWAHIVNPLAMSEMSVADAESQLCPFGSMGECRYGDRCAYVHGDICEFCGKAVLHPTHRDQRKSHEKVCLQQHEAEMEIAFAFAKSKEKTCGICMEVVMEKQPNCEARFGILPNCNHCFCLSCLRKWRQSNFEHKIIRSCPECRQTSDYICPSRFWVDTEEEKAQLLNDYKSALNAKECKYYKRGDGECPFGNKCFYSHTDSAGNKVDVGPPQRRPRRTNADGEFTLVQRLLFYDFFEERDGRLNFEALDLIDLDILDLLSDTTDSDFEDHWQII